MHKELATERGDVSVQHSGCWEYPQAMQGDLWVEIFQWFMGGLPAGVLNTDSRNHPLLMLFDILICLFSYPLPTLVMEVLP